MPGTSRSELSPQIERMIGALGVRWIEPDVYYKYTGAYFGFEAQGKYHIVSDSISVRSGGPGSRETDYVFLHELIHWTGHESRLARKAMTKAFKTQDELTCAVHQEEVIAEIGACMLAWSLGLDRTAAESYMTKYLPLYPKADLSSAYKDAQIAHNYVMSRLSRA